MVLNQQRLRLQLAKAAALRTLAAPNTGMSSPFCLRSASNPTTSELYRQTAMLVLLLGESIGVGGDAGRCWRMQ
jgi:hypothetical protein